MTAIALMLAALLAADHRCGTTARTTSRFRGTVRSVKTLAEGAPAGAYVVDFDPLFVVAIHVDRVQRGVTEPRVGQRILFAIHSPTRTFADGTPRGRSFDLQAERVDCDGRFERFATLERRWR
jgi:hypothetical protein